MKVKRISLTQGEVAIVDAENFDWLNQWKWYAWWNKDTQSYYAVRNSKGKDGKRYSIFMAREILGLKKGDKRQADHRNHNTLDNRKLNLRIVTNQQNHFNEKNPKGYSWHKNRKKYMARIAINGKSIYLGLFNTAKEARATYLKAKEKYHKI